MPALTSTLTRLAIALTSFNLISLISAASPNGYSVTPHQSWNTGRPHHHHRNHTHGSGHHTCDTPQRVVGGYYGSWAAYGREWYLSDIPYADLTHFYYSFIYLRKDGKIEVGDPYIDLSGMPEEEQEPIIANLDPRPPPDAPSPNPPLNSTLQPSVPFQIPPGLSKNISTDIGLGWFRQNKNLTEGCKIMVALGGWTWSNNFAEVAKDQGKREVFAQSVKEFLEEWGLDGIDIDWEYPTAARVGGTPEDKQNFVLLMKSLREAVGNETVISIATTAGTLPVEELEGQSLLQGSIDVELAEYVDMFNVMGYDFAGYWSDVVTHNAPLYGNVSVSAAVDQLKAIGIPSSKIILGVPSYGYMFHNTDGTGMGGPMLPNANFVEGTWDAQDVNVTYTGNFDYTHIQQAFVEGNASADWTYGFDNVTASSYLWNKEKNLVVTYDSVEVMRIKSDYVEKQELGGMFMWDLTGDRYGDLIDVMAGVVVDHVEGGSSSVASPRPTGSREHYRRSRGRQVGY